MLNDERNTLTILVLGLNHKTANVNIREKLAFNAQKLDEGIVRLKSLPEIDEVAILSTCNRVEIYALGKDALNSSDAIKNFLSEFHSIKRDDFEKAMYFYSGQDSVRHIFRVASSLDSMIVGEPQILGQLKEAFVHALNKKTTGVILNRLMKNAISAAKRIRTDTRIAENAVSISFAAVELAKKIFKELSGKTFMLVGAGEMAELAARHLLSSGVKDVRVANRTYERGCELARDFNGRAVKFDNLLAELVTTDIVICSTGAADYIIKKDEMQKIMKERRYKPVFLIDISVPRNIDPDINQIDNAYLYNIDDLQEVVDSNMLERKKEAEKAEKIIDEEVEKFTKWMASLDSVPTIVALREKAEEIKNEELGKLRNKYPDIDADKMKAFELAANSIINKLIHPPVAALKENSDDRDELIAVIRKLYGINGEEHEE